MSKYIDLTKIGTKYSRRMNYLSNKIFGEVTKNTDQKSMKVVKLFSEKPINKRSEIVDYYPRLEQPYELVKHLRLYGLFRDEHKDFNEEYERMKVLKGKDRKSRKDKKGSVLSTL